MTDYLALAGAERARDILNATSRDRDPPQPLPMLEMLRGLADGSFRQYNTPALRQVERIERELGVNNPEPHKVTLRHRDFGIMNRADVVGTNSEGGYLVDFPNLAYSAEPQPVSVVSYVEHMYLDRGAGNVSVPKGGSTLSGTWATNETTGYTDQTLTTGQAAATPHTLLLGMTISRLLKMASNPSVEGVVSTEMSNNARSLLSAAIVNGSGSSGQPTGILNNSSIGTGSGATAALSNTSRCRRQWPTPTRSSIRREC